MLFFSVLIASLLGSAHCASMCGGLISYCIGQSRERSSLVQTSYHAGRLFTYVLLGALAGGIGSTIDQWVNLSGIQSITGITAGLLLIFWGIRSLANEAKPVSAGPVAVSLTARLYRVVFRSASIPSWTARAFVVGALSTFLPCGWLYAFVAVAASSAHVTTGMLIMFGFWLGSLPALSAVAIVSRKLGDSGRLYLPKLTALLLIFAGVFSLQMRFPVLGEKSPASCHEVEK